MPTYDDAFAQLAQLQATYTSLCDQYGIGVVALALNLRVETIETILGLPQTGPGPNN